MSNLLGVSYGGGSEFKSREAQSGNTTGNAPSSKRVSGVSTESLKMVVDERANALIFFTTGSKYRGILPLLEKLDIMPKQVMLDITIAEVSLQDEFKFGVEW